ncbi:MAG: ABC transporter ATP-binding protein [Chloroflexota bacterium]
MQPKMPIISSNKNVIETRGLSKTYGDVQALKSVDLQVPRNSIFGFLGPNGAGKTTAMKILLGLARPTGGSGAIFGLDIVRESVAIRERIGYLPQQPRFIDYMTARENLEFAARIYFRPSRAKIRARCDEMLELVGLTNKAERPIRGFSGGEKQRLGIALAQIHSPELLILDEPAAALDPLGRQDVLEIMTRLRGHATIFYSTHILDDVQRVSDTVAILTHGQMVASGPIEQILNGKDGVIYTLVTKNAPPDFAARLESLPWVTKTSLSEKNGQATWLVNVSDEAAAEANLLRHVLGEPALTVLAFSRKKYELEEVFMEIVRGDSK